MKIHGTYFRYHYAKFSDYLQKLDMWCCQEMAKIMVFNFFEGCFWHHLINSLSFHDLKTFCSWLFIFEQCFVRIYQIFWGSIMFRQDSSWHSQRFNDFAQEVLLGHRLTCFLLPYICSAQTIFQCCTEVLYDTFKHLWWQTLNDY